MLNEKMVENSVKRIVINSFIISGFFGSSEFYLILITIIATEKAVLMT